MKKLLSIIITLVLVLSMSVNVFAAENTSQTVTGTYNAEITEKTVYSVDIAWGSMEFTYEVPADVWDGENHKYVSGGDAKWSYASGANAVTVTNSSNAAMDVAVTANVTADGVTATVTNGSFTLGSAAEGATTEVAGEKTKGGAEIVLSGVLKDTDADKSVIGSVTVTITETLAGAKLNAIVEALRNGETVKLDNLTDVGHKALVAAVDEAFDGVLLSKTQDVSTTYSVTGSFADALPLWTDGTTLTLLSDTPEYPDNFEIKDKSVALDLNGYKLSLNSTENKYCTVHETGKLTVRDTRGGGVYRTYHLGMAVKGVLNIESGTFHNYVATWSSGTINMTGGLLLGNDMTKQRFGVSNEGTFNMSGGTISSGKAVWGMSGSITNISGDAVLAVTETLFSANKCTNIITGGTFSHDPSEWVDFDNYTVTYNETEGTYVVTAK